MRSPFVRGLLPGVADDAQGRKWRRSPVALGGSEGDLGAVQAETWGRVSRAYLSLGITE